ncbi:MAG: DUF1439 domain-containing protein [Methylococcales bacterium]|jgi:hypothetical protein|nr:DUF1439 domain-containing protein [Methylococcales bacterium]MBT7444431.1 DUF1439 domain-containing protein [Methylococcales bacterium]
MTLFKQILLGFCIFLFGVTQAIAFTVELTEAELQEKIDAKMPLQKSRFYISVIISDPDVVLMPGSDRLGIQCKIVAALPGNLKGNGTLYVDGGIEYVQEEGAFYFVDPKINTLVIEGISKKVEKKVKKLVGKVVKHSMNHFPVYTFKNNLKHKFAKALLDSVTVKDEKLILEMSVF